MLVLDSPSQSQVEQLASKLFLGDIRKLLQISQIFFSSIAVIVEPLHQLNREWTGFIIESVDFSLSQAFEIFASQETASKGTPSNKSVVVIFEKGQVFNLIFFPCEHAVFVLRSNWLMEIELLADGECIKYAFGVPVGSGPIESLTVFNYFVESSANFLKRSQIIVVVSIQDIHIIELQSLKGSLNTFADMFATDEQVRVDIWIGSGSNLGGDHHIFSCHLQALQDLSKLCFSIACIINLCSIKVIDAIFQSGLEDKLINSIVLLLGIDHVSQGDD